MGVLSVAISAPRSAALRVVEDLGAIERLIRTAPDQIERVLALGEEIAGIGYRVLEIAERLDQRANLITQLGERLDARAEAMLVLGTEIQAVGGQIDERGAELVTGASTVSDAAKELVLALPTLERALDLATPLEGAIDRFGRLVDRFPGGNPGTRRRPRDDE